MMAVKMTKDVGCPACHPGLVHNKRHTPPWYTHLPTCLRAALGELSSNLLCAVACQPISLFSLLFCTPPPTYQKSFITFSTSNTTTACTQMDLPFVGVQGHQKPLENTKTLMKIDVFLCLVVQEPGVYRGPPPAHCPVPDGRYKPPLHATRPKPRTTGPLGCGGSVARPVACRFWGA